MKTVVVIPTYNEKENIRRLINRILRRVPDTHILIVDDNSPDDTEKIVEEISADNPQVHILERKDKRGYGSACVDGFKEAMRIGADLIIGMDGDFSHNPRFIPAMIQESFRSDVVIGSRMIPGGMQVRRSFIRRYTTLFANLYVRAVMGRDVRDWTSGFRCYTRRALEKIGLDSIVSEDISVLEEMLYACARRGCVISEVPIVFVERRKGQSKLNRLGKTIHTFLMILKIRFLRT
ncbi:MAG TPA: glycosyltransferase [bacterium]|nr:glycosyltransferase [bacterium]